MENSECDYSPSCNAVFVLLLLAIYEIWAFACTTEYHFDSFRTGADLWLRCNLSDYRIPRFLAPAVVIAAMTRWVATSQAPVAFNVGLLIFMGLESVFFALSAFCLASLVASVLSLLSVSPYGGLIVYLGTGVYEEFEFRFCLLSGCMLFLAPFMRKGICTGICVCVTSLAFSIAHYQGMDLNMILTREFNSFFIRFLSGIYLSLLYLYRGFGVAVGCHAVYDILIILKQPNQEFPGI